MEEEKPKSLSIFITSIIYFLENEATLLINEITDDDNDEGYIKFNYDFKFIDNKDINEKELEIERENPVIYISSDKKWYREAKILHIRGETEMMKKEDVNNNYYLYKYLVSFNDKTISVNDDKDIPKKTSHQSYILKKEEELLLMNLNNVYMVIDYCAEFVKTLNKEDIKTIDDNMDKNSLPPIIPFILKRGGEKETKIVFVIEIDELGVKFVYPMKYRCEGCIRKH